VLIGKSPDSSKASGLTESFAMRPGIEQPVYFFVNNPTNTDGKFSIVVAGAAAEVSVPAGKTQQVTFAKPAPAAPPAPPPGTTAPPADVKPPWTDLKDSPPVLAVQLLEEGKEIESRKIALTLVPPTSYLVAPEVKFENFGKAGKNRLSVRVKTDPKFISPDCVVQLVLPPERIEGLVLPVTRDADLRGVLSKPDQEVLLFARDLRFLPGVKPKAEIYLTVDGYQHAYTYETEFSPIGEATVTPRGTGENYRIVVRPSGPAGEKLPVRIEADNCPNPNDDLELALGIDRAGHFEKSVVKILHGCRDKKVRFRADSADGALIFQTEVNDWVENIDTAGVLGKRTLRVRPLKQADDETAPEGRADIILDSTPPEDLQIINPPATAFQGAFVAFKASGKDDESDIKEVVFFLGKPPADGKLPPTLDTYKATRDATGNWNADVPMPSDKKGPTLVSALFTNGAGLSASASATVTVLDPAAPAPPPKPGKIEGKLLEGDRPQAKLDVTLLDDKGAEKGKTKTKDDGTFVFENVPAGKYKVTATKTASVTKAEQPVEVKPGETAKVEAKLFR
jgi:hypothetical protein